MNSESVVSKIFFSLFKPNGEQVYIKSSNMYIANSPSAYKAKDPVSAPLKIHTKVPTILENNSNHRYGGNPSALLKKSRSSLFETKNPKNREVRPT